jgi:arylsulfatase A-like enzyme
MDFRDRTSDRRTFLKAGAAVMAGALVARAESRPPNIILIVADDLGYGDLSCYGSGIATPNIDQMAQEGVRFTQFSSTSPVCSPSRASWMTGRYPTRVGVDHVLDVDDPIGLPQTETTLARMLKGAGYSTMCVGKWHLGSLPQYLPTSHGFDEFWGIPYSTDQGTRPLMHNLDVVERPAELCNLTFRNTAWATDFISRSRNSPFFLYLAHPFPHLPLAASPGFIGRSYQGLYGDVVQEIDWSVGQVLQSLKDNGIDSNTLVMVSSDHGPWYQGSPGRLRGRKGETWEGGVRVPFVARFPGFIPGNQVAQGFASSLDILPTVAGLTGAPLPPNPLDGIDIAPLLEGQASDLPREAFLYFKDAHLQCARLGNWKLHVSRYNAPAFSPPLACGLLNLPLAAPELYDLVTDVDESHDRADRNPAVVKEIRARMERLIQTFPGDVVDSWQRTLQLPVEDTPVGCLPVLKS